MNTEYGKIIRKRVEKYISKITITPDEKNHIDKLVEEVLSKHFLNRRYSLEITFPKTVNKRDSDKIEKQLMKYLSTNFLKVVADLVYEICILEIQVYKLKEVLSS